MAPELRILHLLIALLSILVTVVLTIRDVEKKGLHFEMRLERLPDPDRPERQSQFAMKMHRHIL